MNSLSRGLVAFVVLFHLGAFVLEAVLWMEPVVYERVLGRLTDTTTIELREQALILRALFINQGFYNLFLASGGIAGFVGLARGHAAVGRALIQYMCLFALGAGLVLAASTRAYVGALLQATSAALALLTMYRSGARGSAREQDSGTKHPS
jgi:putative membrane protein